jgi:hypothetical protein
MAIWLGEGGGLRLKRKGDSSFYTHVEISDVDVPLRRLSAEQAVNALITGDRVSITHVDESGADIADPLEFVASSGWSDNQRYPDGQWYVNVDPVGGVRLYHSWSESIAGGQNKAVELLTPTKRSRIKIALAESEEHCLGQTTSWQLNTNREVADITTLGEGFRKNQAVLVSGSGELECLFDAVPDACGGDFEVEHSIYLHKLALRQEIGSTFTGVFLLKRKGVLPITVEEKYRRQELFYLCDCVITDVASEVDTETIIRSRVAFVTTGPIQLLFDYPLGYLLQETPSDPEKVLQESDFGIVLEIPS